jgi:hypothetical protein
VTELEDDLRTAEDALNADECRHAAHHLAGAVAVAPQSREVLSLLERFATVAGDQALSFVPEKKGMFHGTAALRSWLLERSGQLGDALRLILSAQRADPSADYVPWIEEWLAEPGALSTVDVPVMAQQAVNTLGAALDVTKKRRLIAAVEKLLAAHPESDLLFYGVCVSTRNLGDTARALALARALTRMWHLRAP